MWLLSCCKKKQTDNTVKEIQEIITLDILNNRNIKRLSGEQTPLTQPIIQHHHL